MKRINNIAFLLFYSLYQKHNDFNARFSSVLLLTIIYAFYLMALLFGVEAVLEKDITPSFSGTFKKELGMLVVIILMLPVYLLLNNTYRNQVIDRLTSRYKRQEVTSVKNKVLVILFIVFPFMLMYLLR